MRRLAPLVVLAAVLGAAGTARAQVAEPAPRPDEQFDVMNFLTQHGAHDLDDESWNAYGQATFITSYKAPFAAKYTNLNGSNSSLRPGGEVGWTQSVTLFLGARLWPGGEAYLVPELIAEAPLSNLKGLGGVIQDFELQKNGTTVPQVYRSRAYLQQTFDLGGTHEHVKSDALVLATTSSSRHLAIRVGNFSVIDFLDKNAYAGDLHQTFFNMAFLTYAAYDFVADARGYSWGGMARLQWDDWAVRYGRLAPPVLPNAQPLTLQLDTYYGDQIELEHAHTIAGQTGVVRLLAYRNVENMGRFSDAVSAWQADPTKNAAGCPGYNYGSTNAGAPDLCWVRRSNVKTGIGLNVEQGVTADLGVFARAMWSDGQTEVYSFTSTDRSLSFGAVMQGTPWRRPNDIAGAGIGLGWISDEHANYLRLGGVDGFIGDGAINVAMESVLEAFYSFAVLSDVWVSADYQHLSNPAFNSDRGPVEVFGGRVHAEF